MVGTTTRAGRTGTPDNVARLILVQHVVAGSVIQPGDTARASVEEPMSDYGKIDEGYGHAMDILPILLISTSTTPMQMVGPSAAHLHNTQHRCWPSHVVCCKVPPP